MVAIPFFVVIFASLVYIVALYAQKERTMREARQNAWTYALRGCSGSEATTQGFGGSAVTDLGIGGDPNQFNGDPQGGGLFSQQYGQAVSTSKGKAKAGLLIGGYTKDVATTTRVQCNEVPHDGDPLGMLTYAWGSLTSW